MSRLLLSGIGLIGFAGLFCLHVFSVWRVAGYYLPEFAALCGVLLALVWLAGIGLFVYAIKKNTLKPCMLAVFLYAMTVILAGMRVLEGVPQEVGKTEWRDPQRRLTPDSKYLVHNHGNVVRALSEAEYGLYLNYVTCYFSAGFMLFAAALCLHPLDRDGQVFARRRVIRFAPDSQPLLTCRCPRCSGLLASDAVGRWPAWCPHCGADFLA